MKVRLKGVNTVRRYRNDGSCAVYYYHRATGRQIKGERNSPEFISSYADAERSMRERSKGTISDLIKRFEASVDFDRAESTKAEYRRKFKIIERKWGAAPISCFNEMAFKGDVLSWRDSIAPRGKREADNLVSALSRLGSWLLERGEVDRNVLDKIKRIYRSDRSDKLWLPEHVAAFEAVATPEIRTAMMLAMHTGQRQGDLRRLAWASYDGERLELVQNKGRRRISIKCTRALKAHLDELPRRGVLIMLTPTGLAWTKRYLNQKWDEAYLDSKITAGLHFHDLRVTAVTMLAEAQCTIPEIVAITGHSIEDATRILEVYLSRTRQLADAAIIKLDRWMTEKGH